MIYFSKTTNGFYDSIITDTFPSDVVEITQEVYKTIIKEASNSSKILSSDVNGYPIVIDRIVDIDELKNKQWERIKSIRDQRQLNGVKLTIGGEDYWFHTDIQSQIQHLGLYESAKNILNSSVSASMSDKLTLNGADIVWKCMGNKMLILTVQIVFDLIEADKTLMNDTFRNAEIHKIGLYESTDPLGYDYTTGWTVNYEGN